MAMGRGVPDQFPPRASDQLVRNDVLRGFSSWVPPDAADDGFRTGIDLAAGPVGGYLIVEIQEDDVASFRLADAEVECGVRMF